tara:strand:- start:112 stop:369 length:258 start_codon:yes stop_codon:yes gene_type:complete
MKSKNKVLFIESVNESPQVEITDNDGQVTKMTLVYLKTVLAQVLKQVFEEHEAKKETGGCSLQDLVKANYAYAASTKAKPPVPQS